MKTLATLILSCIILSCSSGKQNSNHPLQSHLERRSRTERLLQDTRLSGAQVGVYAVNLTTGQTIANYNEDKLFNPASLTKLFTAAVALESLGPNHTFQTQILASAPADSQGTLNADLIMKGEGDPSLTGDDLRQLAKSLKDLGLTKVEGDLLVDDHYLHGPPYPPGWDWEDLTWYYAPKISRMTINENAITLDLCPADNENVQAHVKLWQEVPHYEVINEVITSKSDTQSEIHVIRSKDPSQLIVRGQIPLGHPMITERIAIDEPGFFAAKVFLKALNDEGIELAGSIQKEPSLPENVFPLAVHQSQPLAAQVLACNKDSQNLTAELLHRTVGAMHRRSPEDSLASLLNDSHVSSKRVSLKDGSGLSLYNLVRPVDVVHLLAQVSKREVAQPFEDSLPIAGKDGTLSTRFKKSTLKNRLKAKTGTTQNVTALAGYAETLYHHHIAFCVIVNNHLMKTSDVREDVDWLVEKIILGEKQ